MSYIIRTFDKDIEITREQNDLLCKFYETMKNYCDDLAHGNQIIYYFDNKYFVIKSSDIIFLLSVADTLMQNHSPKFSFSKHEKTMLDYFGLMFELTPHMKLVDIASKSGDLDALNFFCQQYMKNEKNLGCKYDITTMEMATCFGNKMCVKYLHKIGCLIDKHILEVALQHKKLDVVQYFIEHDCECDLISLEKSFNFGDKCTEYLKYVLQNQTPDQQKRNIAPYMDSNFIELLNDKELPTHYTALHLKQSHSVFPLHNNNVLGF